MLSKLEIKAMLLEKLSSRLEILSRVVMDSHAAAIDPGSKAESKYDTRSLEESYLAKGQAKHLEDLQESIRILDAIKIRDFSPDEKIVSGAIVELGKGANRLFFLMLPCAGGIEIPFMGSELTILSPDSPLYQSLLGKRVGDMTQVSSFQILSLR